VDAGDLVGDDVEVLGRVQGDGDATHRTDGLGPLPAAVDDDVGLDRAAIRSYAGDGARANVDADHAGPFEHQAPAQADALGQGLRHVGRVRGAIARQPDGAQQVRRVEDGVELLGPVGADELALQVEGLGGRDRTPELHHALRRTGDRHAPTTLVSGPEAGLGLEPAVELGRVLHQPGAVLGRSQLTDQPRRVPGRSA
jgi:hypothetical protein